MTVSSDRSARLALGTAQFGMDYGISNKGGMTPPKEVSEVLALARHEGVTMLDTAPAYGDAQGVLGSAMGGLDFSVVTKVPPSAPDPLGSLERSLGDLCVSRVYGVLFHGSQGLLSSSGDELWRNLARARDLGLTDKIGVSVYDPEEALAVMDRYDPDLVQIPLNLLDRRFKVSGVLERMKDRGMEVHARSSFLQGLLLMDLRDLDPYFAPAMSALKSLRSAREAQGATALEAALGYVFSIKGIDRVVVGVNSKRHLQEILKALRGPLPAEDQTWTGLSDRTMINPGLWPKGVGR